MSGWFFLNHYTIHAIRMLTPIEVFERFNSLTVLIVGDVMIDRYVSGAVHRISPEAPVPVVQHQSTEDRLGGAANVALNIRALGATPLLCSVIGADGDGEAFMSLLPAQDLSSEGILSSSQRITTVKTRVMAGAQHLLRIDHEITTPLDSADAQALRERVFSLLDTRSVDVVLFQDYNKGTLAPALIASVIRRCKERGIPTAVDPKFHHFWAYQGVTLFKPNLKEIRAQLSVSVLPERSSLLEAAAYIRGQLGNKMAMITLSEHGIFVEENGEGWLLPTQPRPVADVSGAGDTVISVVSLGLALGLPAPVLGLLGNLAGGQVCEQVGVVPVNKLQLLEEFVQIQVQTT